MIIIKFKFKSKKKDSHKTRMVDANPLIGVRRPRIQVYKPEEIVHRFSAKSDFVRYFKDKCN